MSTTPAVEDRYDLVVVGAGIVGTHVAFQARERWPGWRIALFDGRPAGGGATGSSVGVSFPLGRAIRHRRLVQASGRRYLAYRSNRPTSAFRDLQMLFVVPRRQLGRFERTVVGGVASEASDADMEHLREQLPDCALGTDDVVLRTEPVFQVDARALVEEL